jgi:methylglutaconyl-CoA hydratase
MSCDTYFSGEYIRIESDSFGVKRMIFMRPDVRNAFHAEMILEITTALEKLSSIENPQDMRLLIIEGEGNTFCAGADLNYMKTFLSPRGLTLSPRGLTTGAKQKTLDPAVKPRDDKIEPRDDKIEPRDDNYNDAQNLAKMFYALANFPVPVICAVRGAAIAGGLGIVACSDYTLAHEDSIFATSEVLLGIVPGIISPYILRKIGVTQASFLMLTGSRINAQKAFEINLINKVTNESSFVSDLDKVTKEFLIAGPIAARKTKELIKNSAPLPSLETIEFTIKQIAAARSSEEGKTGISSFFDKKAPYWKQEVGGEKK